VSVKGVTEGMVEQRLRWRKCCDCGVSLKGQTRIWRVSEKEVCCNHCHCQSLFPSQGDFLDGDFSIDDFW